MDNKNNTQETVLHFLRIGLGEKDVYNAEHGWEKVYDEAAQLGVSPFVFDGYVKKYDARELVSEMPVAEKMKWIATVFNSEALSATHETTANDLAHIFAEGGLRTYVLKGYVIAECYPQPKHRQSVDLDCFLVSAEDQNNFDSWEKGNLLIEKHGFSVARDFYKNSTFHLPQLMVENHKFLTPFRGNKYLTKLEAFLQGLIRADEGKDKIDDTELLRPPVMASALFLVEHSFSHFLHEGLNLRHITDWMMFSRYHKDDISWPQFESYIDEFGFRRFYDAYVHVGKYVLGDIPFEQLTAPEQRMMNSVWEGLDLHDTVRGFRGKLNLVGNTFRARWKYKYFSPISMIHALWIQVKGFLFIKQPKLN
ncbi:MAG: nucleotidyltransferase family protein [Bacteroidales bacterium]|nr:nucleotidyltransferase family protein [Bacteroidales bacterium]